MENSLVNWINTFEDVSNPVQSLSDLEDGLTLHCEHSSRLLFHNF